jgi:hypothetical protein
LTQSKQHKLNVSKRVEASQYHTDSQLNAATRNAGICAAIPWPHYPHQKSQFANKFHNSDDRPATNLWRCDTKLNSLQAIFNKHAVQYAILPTDEHAWAIFAIFANVNDRIHIKRISFTLSTQSDSILVKQSARATWATSNL